MNTTKPSNAVDKAALEAKVKAMYEAVAEEPHQEYHFEMGRDLAVKLGYQTTDLDRIPAAALDSFAGVGCYFPLAAIRAGEKVLDLGSGSGTDAFIASLKTGDKGMVTGIDMTRAQLAKARRLAAQNQFENIKFMESYIEELPLEDGAFDLVISNGVINLSAEKHRVFAEISRVLRNGGRMAISDIVTEVQMPESITCNSTLWAACIGGAMQQDEYFKMIEQSGMQITQIIENRQYQFISKSAIGASNRYGVKSISILAVK